MLNEIKNFKICKPHFGCKLELKTQKKYLKVGLLVPCVEPLYQGKFCAAPRFAWGRRVNMIHRTGK